MATALITGGAKRVGRAIALALAEMKWNIALHYRTSEKEAEALSETIRNTGVECRPFAADLERIEEVTALVPAVREFFQDLNLLINSASIFERIEFFDTDPDILMRFWNVNFRAPFFLTQEFARHCKKGQVINILDTKINRNSIKYFPYSLSKKSLEDFTRMAAETLGPDIRVNGISPGLILPSRHISEADFEKMGERLPLRMTGGPEFIVKTVLFFLENSFITGEVIAVDGGEHLKSS
jgi:NAD(P)-dependent dehydrogenase (short-subunit alcohol dehydrogenase family)